VLELAIAKELYDRYPDASEGRLAKIRSHVVSRQSCAAVARELRMGERLADAAGASLASEELSRVVKSRNVTAALLEAAIAALFLEHGYSPIAPAIVAAFSDRIEYARTTHERHFSCAAQIDGVELGAGTGRTKKEAEQEAAKQALAAIGA
jgi:ribonuclease III